MKQPSKHHKHPPLTRANWSDDVTAPLFGLVLAGGYSQRMGMDKGELDYHGKPQREYTADLIKPFTEDAYLSIRSEQQGGLQTAYPTLADSFLELGPYGAILSAFRFNPNAAWLVLACDLPLLDPTTLQQLMACRDPQRMATSFRNAHDGFPEPLIAIWEPRSYAILLDYLSQGRCCPRKVLINEDVELLDPQNPDALINANTPEDIDRIKASIGERANPVD